MGNKRIIIQEDNVMSFEQSLIKVIDAQVRQEKIQIGSYSINSIHAGSGEPVLLIHGLNIGWGQWYKNIAKLAENNSIYAIDLPGSGASTKKSFFDIGLNDYVNVVDEYIKKKRLEKLTIIAHSFGAWVALKLAIEKRSYLKKLILVDPFGFTNYIPLTQRPISIRPFATFISTSVMKPSRKNLKNFLRSTMQDEVMLAEDFFSYYHQSVNRGMVTHPLMMMSSLSRLFKLREEIVLKDDLAKIKLPVLVIMGEKDKIIPIKTIINEVGRFPSAELKVIEGVGHVPSLEKSEEFNNIISEFIYS
ncbi:alpha/beta fold hydrolase [Patescibacteria group bacterium]